jgi:hypothetical protein
VVDVAQKGLAIAISFINGRTTPRASKPLFADLIRLYVNTARYPAQRRSSRPRTGIVSKSRLSQSMATIWKPQFETLEHINEMN